MCRKKRKCYDPIAPKSSIETTKVPPHLAIVLDLLAKHHGIQWLRLWSVAFSFALGKGTGATNAGAT